MNEAPIDTVAQLITELRNRCAGPIRFVTYDDQIRVLLGHIDALEASNARLLKERNEAIGANVELVLAAKALP